MADFTAAEMDLQPSDVVMATMLPHRNDDLKPHAREWIGVRMRWYAAWVIEEGPYTGQMAMTPFDPTPQGLKAIGWVPLCDLTELSLLQSTLAGPAEANATRIIAPSPEELEAFKAACERAGRHFAEHVRRVEIDLIFDLLKQPPQAQQGEKQADEADQDSR
jgi:hypothetical protein